MDFKPGDLVMNVKAQPCCGHVYSVGRAFTVVSRQYLESKCHYCGRDLGTPLAVESEDGKWYLASCLIKIDPPAQGETRKELLHVPA